MITLEIFKNRRKILLNKMAVKSAALFFSASTVIRNNGNQYPYRQNSNFWYFTGFNEPNALLILIKNNYENHHSILFNQETDVTSEMWSGRRLGQKKAIVSQGVNIALPWNEIDIHLYQILNGLDIIYHAIGENREADKVIFKTLDKLRCGFQEHLTTPYTIIDWRLWVHEMRLFKQKEEINILRTAGKITAKAHKRAMKTCHPGMFEYQLEGEIHHEFSYHGARLQSYNTIIGSGKNACILHYTENNHQMRNGDLVLIDAGCEFQGYASDISRTFPINGKFNTHQLELYNIVLKALSKALSMFRPGISIYEVYNEVKKIIIAGLIKLDILHGSIERLCEKQAHLPFFMHNLSHWIGLDVHDVGDYYTPKMQRKLEPGMVLSVEPGLYMHKNNKVPIQYRDIGIRIEDTIVITESGYENLTNDVPKNPHDIEAMMMLNSKKSKTHK